MKSPRILHYLRFQSLADKWVRTVACSGRRAGDVGTPSVTTIRNLVTFPKCKAILEVK